MKIHIDYIFITGIVAQLFFGLRVIFQWVVSEKHKQVISPVAFWLFSLVGCFLFMIYGWLREDWVIIAGQSVSFYIYIKNLKLNHFWYNIPSSTRYILLILPPAMLLLAPFVFPHISIDFFYRSKVPGWLLIIGFTGQFLMSARFIFQVFYSIRLNYSVLPRGFWVISLGGSVLLIVYAVFRKDAVLLLAQSLSLIPYFRNLYFDIKNNPAKPGPA